MRIKTLLIALALLPLTLFAQHHATGTVSGHIVDGDGEPVEFVNIAVPSLTGMGTVSDLNGYYTLTIPADTTLTLQFSFIGYKTLKEDVRLAANEKRKLNVTMVVSDNVIVDVVVEGRKIETGSIARLNPREATAIPSTSGSGVEDLIKTQMGVSSTNEMSSQYNVRGGSFDENLVYVNGIEIYRPFLVGSGKQEGLSFVNSALVENIIFSAGGFAAEYGDKMSSVLDVTYRKPTKPASSVSMSFLGFEASTEGISKDKRFSFIAGARYKNTRYVLNAMNTQGTYMPNFTDVQTLLTYDISNKLKLSALGYYSRNYYLMIPKTGVVTYGAYQVNYQCNIYYEGSEVDKYTTGLGAISLDYNPSKNVNLKMIASGYSADEAETYDVLGEYYIGEMNSQSDDESQTHNPVSAIGVGGYLKHARNFHYSTFAALDHKGSFIYNDNNIMRWGVRFRKQFIDNSTNEWTLSDSTGYTLPYSGVLATTPEAITMSNVCKGDTIMTINDIEGFVQNTWTHYSSRGELLVTGGVRLTHWGYNGETRISPRAGLAFKPDAKNITYRISGGVYNQLPAFRELMNLDGSIVKPENTAMQRSYQIVAGSDINFKAWGRPFVFTAEMYYKYLDRIAPYFVDNLRIRYYTDLTASGYAAGLDMKVYGEFVKGIDSWASLSIMSTQENIVGDYILVDSLGYRLPSGASATLVADTIQAGLIPRPSDQRVNFSIFFQDYIPNYPTFKVNLKLVFGTSLIYREPYAEPSLFFRDTHPYRRVDIGFSKQLISNRNGFREGSLLNHINNCWISLEVFNLLNTRNVVSYTWITDVSGQRHGIPEYLTPRQINLKLSASF